MKKVFTFALVALAAAAVVACQKPASGGTTPGGDTPSGGDYVAIEKIAMDPGVLELEEGESIDLPKVVVTPSNATDKGMAVTWSSKDQNIFKIENNKVVGVKAGTAKIEAILKDSKGTEFGAQANVTVTAPVPAGPNWDYVMNMKNYKINCRIEFDPITVNTGNITLEWRFYANEWNHFKGNEHGTTIMPDGEEIQQWCNRLGKLANANDKDALLLRFSNDAADGTLCLNAGFLGVNQDNGGYVWEAQKWHTLSLTSDGKKLTLYDNGVKVKDYDAATAKDWKFGAVDISETEDDGDVNWCKKQMFNGYLAYIRVWNRALSAEEITENLCDVKSEGLVAGWNFNLDEGSKVANLVKNGPALDFSDVMGDFNRSGNVSEAVAGSWDSAPAPVCPAAE